MTRPRFNELFKIVFGAAVPDDIQDLLTRGESVRDKIAHGMGWSRPEARGALIAVLDFATAFNQFVSQKAGFEPFGDLRGFKGRKQPLTRATTRWILKGMGIPRKEA